MCSIGAAVVGLIGAAAGKKVIDKKVDSAQRRATTVTPTPEENYWGWWNNPNSRGKSLEGRYRLSRGLGRSQVAATKGVSQLRIPSSNNGFIGSVGKAAKKRRIELGIK